MAEVMTVNSTGIRAKPWRVRSRRRRISRKVAVVAAILVGVAAIVWYDWYYGRLGFMAPQPVIEQAGKNRIIRVPPGGNIQAALEIAQSGDIVELQAGAVYRGEVKLPNKPHTDFVTIQSSAAASLPVDKRVGPSQRHLMATIVSGILGGPAVSAAKGSHHYRFVGIEFTAGNARYVHNLLLFGSGETAGNVPHDIEIDRSYLHPASKGTVRRGIALNSADTTIKNSYIEGFGFAGEETQGICGWTGSRNIRILNNYVEGGAENIMFGGADPASADLIPADIEIRSNHLDKRAEWVDKVTLKTHFELKNAKRVIFAGNTLTNNWKGSAFRLTVRNQEGGAPFSTVEDVTIKDNVIIGAGEAINILGTDDTYPSLTMKRLNISNNLFLDIGAERFEGSGYFIQIAAGEDITIANNTVFNTGNITTFYGAMPRNFVMRDNILGHGNYGVHGHADIKSAEGQRMFPNNVIVNDHRVGEGDSSFPPNNFWVADRRSVGFTALERNDLGLSPSSSFKGRGIGGLDLGCDVRRLSPESLKMLAR